ncbi:MAG TPA: glycoside hydrolase family 3 N-terminal domain-containing protein [Gemmatimonadales bacterium]|nr:glycoside hydrolase family 3 N-terminal domain-containing protein [Gemmatimonadales bacterium]
MSEGEKVGQLLMPWLLADYAAFDSEAFARAAAWVDSFQVGGIVISIGSPLDAAAKLNALQRRSRLPLLIAADLEFGAGMRLTGATAFPMVMAIGATNRALDAYELGRVTALEARAVGIHMTFSPVADLNNNPENPIINTRSFGEDPRDVSRLVEAYVRGAREHGLFTTAKHFPGHGDTGTDSHLLLPVINGCWERLDSLELVPFRAAVRAGVTAVMTAHIVYACGGGSDSLPATLSPVLTSGILKDSLGFDGLVVTDALTMGAIVSRFGPGESAVRAFLAGADVLLMPADLAAARRALLEAVGTGRISRERLDDSVRRILRLKIAAGLFQRRTVSLDSIPLVVGRQEFQALADDIAQRSLTLVERGPIDTIRAQRGRTALITYAEETNLRIGGRLADELRAAGESVTVFRLYPPSGALSYDTARTILAAHPRAVFATSVRPIAWRGHVALPDSLASLISATASRKPTVLASFGSPYLLRQLPGFGGAYLLAWSDTDATERAVARALTGQAPITGHLPVTLSPERKRGYGIEVPD